jgi:hypothetical protein
MWSWIPAIISALLAVAKGLFGLDKPAAETRDEKPPPLAPPAPADVLRDLGITSDATGKTGGAFPSFPVVQRPDGSLVGLYTRSNGGDTTRIHLPRATLEGDEERESTR